MSLFVASDTLILIFTLATLLKIVTRLTLQGLVLIIKIITDTVGLILIRHSVLGLSARIADNFLTFDRTILTVFNFLLAFYTYVIIDVKSLETVAFSIFWDGVKVGDILAR